MQPSVQQLLLLPGSAIPAARQQSHELHSPQATGLHPSESHPRHGGCTMGIRGSAPAHVRINPFSLAELNLFYSTQDVYLSFIHESSSLKDRSDFTMGKCSRHLPASRGEQTPTAAQCSYHAPTPRKATEPPFKLWGLRQGIPARKALIFPCCRERGHPCSAASLPAGLLIWLPCAKREAAKPPGHPESKSGSSIGSKDKGKAGLLSPGIIAKGREGDRDGEV